MDVLSPWLLALAPAALLVVGLVPDRLANRHPGRMVAALGIAALTAVGVAGTAALALAVHGGPWSVALGGAGLGPGLYYDTLTAVLMLLVAVLGLVVVRYSGPYLDGDPRQGTFLRWMALTLAAVLTLIVSGSLLQFVVAWVATSLALHQLLVFYRDRPLARLAARKKAIVSRLGDVALVLALLLTWQTFGTLAFADLFAAAETMRAEGTIPAAAGWIAGLLVVGAVVKSAQVPVHGWLTEVMETPTPVSALLHAGVINAGGVLILRLADLVTLSATAMAVLAVIGAATALIGAVVMLTQTSIKVALAWSTIAQMGFMMLQCGLGAFSAALLHIVAHSFYKAHAFLSAGSVVDRARAAVAPAAAGATAPAPAGRVALALGLAVAASAVVATLFGHAVTASPGVFTLIAVLALGVTLLLVPLLAPGVPAAVRLRAGALAVAVLAAYAAVQSGAAVLLAGTLPPPEQSAGAFEAGLAAVVIAAFAAVVLLQTRLPALARDPRWQAVQVHLANGLYLNAHASRIAQRLWPLPPAPAPARADTAPVAPLSVGQEAPSS
ncbi:NADH-quinone oxidoreductase subunit L [Roseospira goensis]|uniref:Probable inorganic carbon transporter subunit DabB n=1 Tax=Roseospira goensis TaxID=391922 RepID=A0A7W6RZN3_9PROT|nr:NADH-quinone oxidoreductase subunit L [Roseospira goensis]MBB4286190.1 NAD(P)H-quinone oxidoreductase subunit 5 [Roseospira goensis]